MLLHQANLNAPNDYADNYTKTNIPQHAKGYKSIANRQKKE